ncbi:4-hydroxy-tetrahydrodipicolinate synthase [Rufibacter quisquiliarum]|uniref:4-hydroxy-tetrahydrodipicolinate synthase n=1 Tax=Rufibacter quisquiliarum TaxID=1549639 RepID=A0A839GL15_9BACT|nr:4-hydroxy-tetrahydrodipicolinate synthase [Rufibacter quisquiliarum]MBA9077499.1 4-hydroxy-tetrahydrodipicolinate synthase [Rufibacter quisquiliarum]
MQALRGTGVALVTPFNQDLSVDFEGFGRLIDYTIENGVDYLIVNGTTGESVTTTPAERKELLAFAKERIAGRKPLVYGLGANDTHYVLDLIKGLDFEGIAAILSVCPYYNKPSQEGVFLHYTAIADASPVPVLLYNVPGRTGINMSAATTLRLAQHPNIIGTKDACGNLEQYMAIIEGKPEGFLVISGDDMTTVPLISVGGDGIITVLGNAFPEKFSRMTRLALEGNFTEAGPLQRSFGKINPLMYEEANPVGIKLVLQQAGICEPYVRLPLAPASESLKQRIKEAAAPLLA